MKITIVGVGALGTEVVMLLRNAGTLKIIDFDRVERKNTLSQLHAVTHVGKNKAQAMQQTMQFLFGVKVEAIPHKLTADNVDALLSGADLIIDCLDNAPSREIVQRYARKTKAPCLHGALAANGEFGRVIWDENFVIDSGSKPGAATCEDGEHLPFIGVVSALLARAAHEFLTKGKKIEFAVHPSGVMRA
jgi:molybdopterin/thiamine biosynthesis adenylyltransferase